MNDEVRDMVIASIGRLQGRFHGRGVRCLRGGLYASGGGYVEMQMNVVIVSSV